MAEKWCGYLGCNGSFLHHATNRGWAHGLDVSGDRKQFRGPGHQQPGDPGGSRRDRNLESVKV